LRDPSTLASLAAAEYSATVASEDTEQVTIFAASGSEVRPGQPVLFTVTETSGGSFATHHLHATVPAYTTVPASQASPGTACSSGTWPCRAGEVLTFVSGVHASPGSQTWQFSATVASGVDAPPARAQLTSVVSSNARYVNSSATGVVVVASGFQLTLRGTPNVATGQTITYDLTYSNAASQAASATLAFPLPTGTSLVSASNGGAQAGGAVQWNLGSIAGGAWDHRQVTVTLNDPGLGSFVHATAQLQDPSSLASLAAAEYSATVASGDTEQTSIVATSGAQVQPGQQVLFTVTEISGGAFATHNLHATVPAYSTVPVAQASVGAACSSGAWPCLAGEVLVFTSGVHSSPRSQTWQFSATVASGANAPPAGTQLTSVVTSNVRGVNSSAAGVVIAP
jgi:uncharacterized repeat protein (TIGR01451 family)